MALGDYFNAISDLTKAIEFNPEYLEAYGNRAIAYLFSKNFEESIFDSDIVTILNPKCIEGYENKGVAYSFLEEHDSAIYNFSKVIELNPFSYTAYHSRAHEYSLISQFNLALNDYTKAIELAPLKDKGILYESRAKLYKQYDMKEKAKEDLINAKKYSEKDYKIIEL